MIMAHGYCSWNTFDDLFKCLEFLEGFFHAIFHLTYKKTWEKKHTHKHHTVFL